MNKTKLEKGITLIALIITIVVLLVIAIVTIGIVQESIIIGHSQKAASEYKIAQEKEQIGIGYSEYIIEKNTTQNAQLKVKGAQVTAVGDAGWEVVFSETNSKYQLDKSGTITYIEEGEDGGQGDGNGENDDSTEEILWSYIDFGDDYYELHYIGNTTELELIEDKDLKVYPGTFNEDTEEYEYDTTKTITIKLSEIERIDIGDHVQQVTVGEVARNFRIGYRDNEITLIVLAEFGDIPEDHFQDNSIKSIVIQEGIENIGSGAFSKNPLQSVTIPVSVKNIEISAFSGWRNTHGTQETNVVNYGGTKQQWDQIKIDRASVFGEQMFPIKVIFNDGTEIVI